MKLEIIEAKHVQVETKITNYKSKYVQKGLLTTKDNSNPNSTYMPVGTVHREKGFFSTTQGKTYICEYPELVKRYKNKAIYDDGFVTFWVRKHHSDNTIYQMRTAKGELILSYNDTVDNAPNPDSGPVSYFLGGALLVIGWSGLFFQRLSQ